MTPRKILGFSVLAIIVVYLLYKASQPAYTAYPDTDMGFGKDMWTTTAADAPAKCASTPGCIGYTENDGQAFGKSAIEPTTVKTGVTLWLRNGWF